MSETYDYEPDPSDYFDDNQDVACRSCGADCYWQEVIKADGTQGYRLFNGGKPHVCNVIDDFQVLG